MSSAGVNPLAIIAPDLYAKQLQIQRRQALAQSLLEQGEAPTGSAQYGGLKNAGSAILGAFLARRGDQDMANLYSPQQQVPAQSSGPTPLPQQDVPEPQISNNPGSGPTMVPAQAQPVAAPQPPVAGNAPSTSPNQALGQALQGIAPTPAAAQPQAAPMAPQAPPQPQMQSPQPRTIPQAMSSAITTLPGMSPQQSMMEYFGNNQAYWTALNQSHAMTDAQKQVVAAFPDDPAKQQEALQGITNKAGTTNITRGMGILPSGERIYAPGPAPTGYINQQGPGGPNDVQVVPMQGGQEAVAGNAYLQGLGRSANKPAIAYDANNMPIATNAATMSGNGAAAQAFLPQNPQQTIPSLRTAESNNNPNAVSSVGARGPMQVMPATGANPGFGVSPEQNGSAAENDRVGSQLFQAFAHRYGNQPDAIVAYNWGPAKTDAWIASGADPKKLPLETQQEIARVVMGTVQRSSGQQPAAQSAPSNAQPMRPELPQGVPEFMKGSANNAVSSRTNNLTAAQDVPTRLNVLQNILNLSKVTQTGTPEWVQEARQVAAGLSQATGHNVDPNNQAALNSEIQKYMSQYALRMQQTQTGGTGSDKQFSAIQEANPHDSMFPSTLQRVVPWLMANEQGIKAKADAQEQYLQQNGQTGPNQIAFENKWRNAYDPRVFQFSQVPPQMQQQWLVQNGIMPGSQAAKALASKRQQLKALGAFQ